MAVKCRSCGADNPDHSFFCGRCAKELPKVSSASEPDSTTQTEPTDHTESWDESEPDPQIAIAINVRRMVLILLLGLVIVVGSNMVGLWIANTDIDFSGAKTIIMLWGVLSTLVVAVGLFYIVFVKRVTELGPSRGRKKEV